MLRHYIETLEAIQNQCVQAAAARERNTSPIPPKRAIIRHAILMEIGELKTLLYMFMTAMNQMKDCAEILKQNPANPPESVMQQFNVADQLRILIKAIYEWLYHLKNHIESDETIKRKIPKKMFEKLKIHCDFRGQLIAHKKGLKIYSMGALRYHLEKGSAEIMMTSFLKYPEHVYEEMSRLYERGVKVCGDIDPAEKNFHERCKQLYKNLDKIPEKDRKDVLVFIRKYGAVSADIKELAEFICTLSKELVPILQDE